MSFKLDLLAATENARQRAQAAELGHPGFYVQVHEGSLGCRVHEGQSLEDCVRCDGFSPKLVKQGPWHTLRVEYPGCGSMRHGYCIDCGWASPEATPVKWPGTKEEV